MCSHCNCIGWDPTHKPLVTGRQFGIGFCNSPYTCDNGRIDPNPQFRVFSEDDGLWHYTGLSASVMLMKDLVRVINRAVDEIEE